MKCLSYGRVMPEDQDRENAARTALGAVGCKLLEAIPMFTGATDVNVWLKKVKAAQKIFGVDIATVLPIVLDGNAYDLYDSCPPPTKTILRKCLRLFRRHMESTGKRRLTGW